MKIFVTAMALVVALPAAAQTAPAPQAQAQQHQDHSQHSQMQHGQAQVGQHEGHGNMRDCCADRNGDGRMDCCENMDQGDRRGGQAPAQQPSAQPQARQNH